VAILIVRNVPDEVHRALRIRARANGKSMEAEVREILQAAAIPPDRVKLGSLLADIGQEAQLTVKEEGAFDSLRDKSPARTRADDWRLVDGYSRDYRHLNDQNWKSDANS